VNEETSEEADIEPRNELAGAATESPSKSHNDVNCVVELAGVLVPTIDQERRASLSLDVLGVLQGAPWQLRDGPRTRNVGTVELHAEAILLRVGGVPNIVSNEEGSEEENIVDRRVLGVSGAVAENEDRLSGVDERNAGHVPEDEHPAPLLMEDVPGGGDAVLTLHDGVGV